MTTTNIFADVATFVKHYLTLHHQLYSGRCQAELWEEICCKALKDAGFGSDWLPDFNHKTGVDQVTTNGIRVSNKSGKLKNNKIKISGSRLTKHKTLEDKIAFISQDHEDYIFCLAQENDNYFLVVIDSSYFRFQDRDWQETYGKKGNLTGWKCEGDGIKATISRSMSDQLWITLDESMFTEFYPITL